ncbi:MAG: hypothetical protein R3236_01175 [Phycisphaeraceae bacterium]|nr:hypothetical protein [Phycisphaeraceae bacterium]
MKIARLFTLSSPHRGAQMAAIPPLTAQHLDLRIGGRFIENLNAPGRDGSNRHGGDG